MDRQGAPAFERSARFWLRAFPRRWRVARGEEVLGVLRDLAAPDATRLDARSAANLVRHGWATRWRGRPPWHRWLGYRTLDLSLPRQCRGWAADDIDGALFPMRPVALLALLYLIIGGAIRAGDGGSDGDASVWFLLVVVLLGSQTLNRNRARRLAREKHLVAEPGEPLLPGTYVAMGAPAQRLPARWAASRLLLWTTTTAALAATAVSLAPTRIASRPAGSPGSFEFVVAPLGAGRWVVAATLAIALAVGLVLGRQAGRRLPALDGLGPQPDREGRAPGLWHEVGVAAGVLVTAAIAVAEAGGWIALSLMPGLGVIALLMVPRTVVMRRAGSRRRWLGPDGSTLAWQDLSWVARRSEPAPVDVPRRVVRRWDGPYVPGQVVLGPVDPGRPADPPWPPIPA